MTPAVECLTSVIAFEEVPEVVIGIFSGSRAQAYFCLGTRSAIS